MVFAAKLVIKNVARRVRTAKSFLAIRKLRYLGIEVGTNFAASGKVHFRRSARSTIKIGDGVILNSLVSRNTLEARGPNILQTVLPGAELTVGQNTGITSATISAALRVDIGERVLIGSGVLITDSDHHIVSPSEVSARRHAGFPTPRPSDRIRIEDDVFIGARSIVLKGVVIGKGSVIGAGSVVSRNIPSGVVAAGNPCVPIRVLKVDE